MHHRRGLAGPEPAKDHKSRRIPLPSARREATYETGLDPQVRLLPAACASEAPRRNPDDPDLEWLCGQDRTDHVGAASEGARPETVADNRDRFGAVPLVFGREVPAADGQTQYPEVAGRDTKRFRDLALDFDLRAKRGGKVGGFYLTGNTTRKNPKRRLLESRRGPEWMQDGHDAFGLRER